MKGKDPRFRFICGYFGADVGGKVQEPEAGNTKLRWNRNPAQALPEIHEVLKQSKFGSGGVDGIRRWT